jgi:allantoicase
MKKSHIRVNMIPDGGISRIRLWGKSLSREQYVKNSD